MPVLEFFLLVKYLSYCAANSVKTLKVVLEYWLLNEYCHVVSYYRHFKHLHVISCLHCIDAGGYALGRASGLLKNSLLVGWQLWFDRSWVHFYMFNGFSFCHYCCHIHRLLLQYIEKCTFRYCPTGCLGMLAVKQGIVCVCAFLCAASTFVTCIVACQKSSKAIGVGHICSELILLDVQC